jgi:hypothetical protein
MWRTTFLLITTAAHFVSCQEDMRPFIDQWRDIRLSPLKHVPVTTCESEEEVRGNLTCCIIKCYRQPVNLILPRLLHDYYVDCIKNGTQPERECNVMTAYVRKSEIESDLDPEKELIPKERKQEMIARINPLTIMTRFARWYVRLFLGWMFHKTFSRAFDIFKTLIRAYIAAGAATV